MDVKDNFSEEIDFLLRIREGDGRAFERIYNRYAGQVYINILRLVKSQPIAEELLQDVFQKVWEKRESIDPSKSFKYYLITIARNLAFDYFSVEARKRNLYDHLVQYSTELCDAVDETLDYKETDTIVKNAIDSLSPQRKMVFTLCKLEGKSYDEVSGILNISPSTISDHIVKATKFIKDYYIRQQVFLLLAACLVI